MTNYLRIDEEGQRSVERRGLVGHYVAGAYRVAARPIATEMSIARAKLAYFLWGMDEVSNIIERLPKRYIYPVVRAFGATIAEDAVIWEGLRIINGARDHFKPLKVGRGAYFGWGITMDLADDLIFGDATAIGNNTSFFTHIDWAN